jgi:hypothetical protein
MLTCTGLARDMLLVEHSSYLRTLLEALAKKPGARSLQYEVALALAELEGRRPLSVPMQQHRPMPLWKHAGQPERAPAQRRS